MKKLKYGILSINKKSLRWNSSLNIIKLKKIADYFLNNLAAGKLLKALQ